MDFVKKISLLTLALIPLSTGVINATYPEPYSRAQAFAAGLLSKKNIIPGIAAGATSPLAILLIAHTSTPLKSHSILSGTALATGSIIAVDQSVESTVDEANQPHKATYRLGRIVGTTTIAATTSFAVLIALSTALSKFFPK